MRRQEPEEFDRTHDKRCGKLISPGDAVFGRLGSGENHERAVLRDLLGALEINGVLIQSDTLNTPKAFFTAPGAGSRLPLDRKRQTAKPGR